MKLHHLVLPVLLMPFFIAGTTIVQSSIASTVSVSSQPPKTKSTAQTDSSVVALSQQVDRTKLDAFKQELLRLGRIFNAEVNAHAYRRRDGSMGISCFGSGRVLEDRRLYINQLIDLNMYLLPRGSEDYNLVINFQNSLINPSDIAIQACH